jgi:hypothetical protein
MSVMSHATTNGRLPITCISEPVEVNLPDWVVDLESFRRWAVTGDLPDHCRVWYLQGRVWMDMSMEQVFTHVLVKTEFTIVLGGLVKVGGLGIYLTDGLQFSNVAADISGIPDGVFVSNASRTQKKVSFIEGTEAGHVELEGSPDMVLEVVSRGSVQKDTVFLRRAYWEAGIREYWLVDVRKEPLSFDILRHTARGYVATRAQSGWLKSRVFGKSFRLSGGADAFGDPSFTLAVR